ncbi:hypothetical protein M758_8G044100 [Ceratodon purpureus]|uniref:PAR1 protein n=1 Tax=Ceratodon purpureus TaxID=3225 RepID=A0A8T0GX48_CERPU|nr:hypothetical protein KC19_8G045300 [Ceratodon purpureus]KAG0607629.1 hypothetical protein M758_8G044100 [Ceratodon purpureus]
MAKLRQLSTIPLVLGLLFSNIVCTLGKFECEDLPIEDCAFSVASTGTRCVLEKYLGKDDSIQYECQSSIIIAENREEWIESDECIKACGLERMSVGLSTDLLLDYHFTEMFCSSECLNNCPNIIDLYISLAAGEGMYLPQLCKAHRTRRVIADPVKKAMDAEYIRSLLPQLTSGGAMAPNGSPIPENGGVPPGLLPRGPDYRGYGGYQGSPGDIPTSGGESAPSTSPVAGGNYQPGPLQRSAGAAMAPSSPSAGGDILPGPLQRSAGAGTPPSTPSAGAAGPSVNKRPFFFIPSSSPTAAASIQPIPGADGTTPEAGIVTPPESGISPSSIAKSESAPVPSEVFKPKELSAKLFNNQQVNDEEYLYETYFN